MVTTARCLTRRGICSLALILLGTLARPVSAANILLNPGFEEGYETYWTRNAGDLNGQGLGEEPHSGAKSWHGAWNHSGSAQTTTYYQDVPVLAGATVNASMWCKGAAFGGVHGQNTHSFRLRIRFRNAAGNNLLTVDGTSNPDDTYRQIVLLPTVAPVDTTHVRVLFSYITTQSANAWKIWNIDDLALDAGTGADQQFIFGVNPNIVQNALNNTNVTITGERLTGVSAVKLAQGATELVATNVVVAGNGKSLTATFPTTGAASGPYTVILEKSGYAPARLEGGFSIGQQQAITGINPSLILDNSSDTNVTITGVGFSGLTAVQLIQGATVLNAVNVVEAPDAMSLTCAFPTSGAPTGDYNVVVKKTGYADATLTNGFRIRDPFGNYLMNGGFESGPGAGGSIPNWGKWWSNWGGDPAMQNIEVGSTEWIHTPKTNNQNDPSPEGEYSFRCGEWNENGGEAGIYQHVPVTPGETLLLAWKWGGGSQIDNQGQPVSSETACEIGVLQGAYTNMQFYNAEDLLGFVRRQNEDFLSFGWLDDSVSFVVPEGVSTITIYTKVSNYTPSKWQYIAQWVDAMFLSQPDCGAQQHSLAGINPQSIQDPAQPFALTVTGTNMNLVSSIKLIRGNDQYFGEIQPGAISGQLVAHFTPPEDGFVVGDYDVVTAQEGCLGDKLQSLSITCGTTIALTGVTPNVLVKPQGLVQLTVHGSNVADLEEVKLVYVPPARVEGDPRPPFWIPITEMVGRVINASNPDAVVMEFDLYNATYRFHQDPTEYIGSAQAGMYKLVGSTGTVCPDPAEALNVFELQLPAGDNAVANPSFEDGVIAPWELIPETGVTTKGDPFPGAELVYAPFGAPWNGFYPADGTHMVGLAAIHDGTWENWRTPNKGYLRQNLGLPNGPGHYKVTLTFWVRMFDGLPAGSLLRASIIADGESNPKISSITARMFDLPYMSNDGFDPYTQLSVDFIGDVGDDLAVEFYFEGNAEGPGQGETSVVTVDNIQLIGITTCGTPVYDLDGDSDVDQEDFGLFQLCYTGNFPGQDLQGACRCLDIDKDGDVDANDLAEFNNCALTSGPAIPANCP